MTRSWTRLGGVLLLTASLSSLAAGCGSGRSVGDGESELTEGFLEPLQVVGIHAVVEKACRYPGPANVPWHLFVQLHLDATPARVTEVLKGEGIIIASDRQPLIIQQHRDMNGWNGGLEASGAGSKLELTFNNAKHSDEFEGLGWAEECQHLIPPAD